MNPEQAAVCVIECADDLRTIESKIRDFEKKRDEVRARKNTADMVLVATVGRNIPLRVYNAKDKSVVVHCRTDVSTGKDTTIISVVDTIQIREVT